MDLRPYVIWAPEYSQRSAGIRALYKLGDELAAHGQQVEIINDIRWPVDDGAILVYPEIIMGNPCQGKRVMRWALKPEVRAKPEDQIWSWSVSFLDALNRRPGRHLTDDNVLNLPLVETELFNNDNPQERAGGVFYRADHLRGKPGFTEITGEWPDTRQELADLLRTSEVLVCGKMSTLIDEARFCGCPVVTFGWERPLRSDYGLDGICWSVADLPEARRTVDEALPKYRAYHARLSERIERFIERTHAWPIIDASNAARRSWGGWQ